MARRYRLKERGARQRQTRRKIVEAAIELHQERGIAATTMSDIAERADVGRVTVYRHFADEAALVGACSAQYFERHPPPDPEAWRSTEDASARLRLGLAAVYAFFRETEPMLQRVYAEARDLPIMEPYHANWRYMAEVLAEPWGLSGRDGEILEAALALALDYETWRLLVRQRGLSDDEAIDLLAALVRSRAAS